MVDKSYYADLSAYLDGELDAERSAEIERALADDEQLAQAYEQLLETVESVRNLPTRSVDEDFADTVMATVERQQLLAGMDNLVDPPRPSWVRLFQVAGAAAVIVLVVAAGYLVYNLLPREDQQGFVGGRPGTKQLALNQKPTRGPVESADNTDSTPATSDAADTLLPETPASPTRQADSVETTSRIRMSKSSDDASAYDDTATASLSRTIEQNAPRKAARNQLQATIPSRGAHAYPTPREHGRENVSPAATGTDGSMSPATTGHQADVYAPHLTLSPERVRPVEPQHGDVRGDSRDLLSSDSTYVLAEDIAAGAGDSRDNQDRIGQDRIGQDSVEMDSFLLGSFADRFLLDATDTSRPTVDAANNDTPSFEPLRDGPAGNVVATEAPDTMLRHDQELARASQMAYRSAGSNDDTTTPFTELANTTVIVQTDDRPSQMVYSQLIDDFLSGMSIRRLPADQASPEVLQSYGSVQFVGRPGIDYHVAPAQTSMQLRLVQLTPRQMLTLIDALTNAGPSPQPELLLQIGSNKVVRPQKRYEWTAWLETAMAMDRRHATSDTHTYRYDSDAPAPLSGQPTQSPPDDSEGASGLFGNLQTLFQLPQVPHTQPDGSDITQTPAGSADGHVRLMRARVVVRSKAPSSQQAAQ